MIATHQLHERLTARADEFVGMLFADGAKRCGNAWRVEKRGSLVINIDRASIVFFDHECGEGGDAVSLYARERGRTAGDALKELAAWVGLAPSLDLLAPEPRKITSKTAKAVPGMIPAEVSAAWTEGSRYLWPNGRDLNRGGVEKLAHWRGWPARFVETLVRCGAIAVPKYYGTRTAAGFTVWSVSRCRGREKISRTATVRALSDGMDD